MKIRAVFDTNIYISAILFGGAPRICLELARRGSVDLYVSKAILLELAQKLQGKFGWPENDTHSVLRGISRFTHLVSPKTSIHRIQEDPSDNMLLEAAQEVKAHYLISGDKKHVLPLKKFNQILIVSPAEFLKKIGPLSSKNPHSA